MQINMKSLPFNQCFEEREISIMIIRHNEIKRAVMFKSNCLCTRIWQVY